MQNIAGREGVGLSFYLVHRTEFGLNWNADLPRGGVAVSNDVRLDVHIELAGRGVTHEGARDLRSLRHLHNTKLLRAAAELMPPSGAEAVRRAAAGGAL